MVNSRSKGARAERELAKLLRIMGFANARRGQQFSGSPDSPDVADAIENVHIEAKHVNALNLYAAMSQSEADCGDQIPTVFHRRDRSQWKVTLRLQDLIPFAKAVLNSLPSSPGTPPAKTAKPSSESEDSRAAEPSDSESGPC